MVHFNLNKVYQTIGRAIRHCVHYELMNEKNQYPQVDVFKYAVSLPDKNNLSIEEILYSKAEKKYYIIKSVERALKEISIDCPINYNGNILPEEVKQQNKEYLEENNNILSFINENYEITLDEKDKIKSSDLLLNYNNYNDFKIDAKKLKQMMDYNRFKNKKMNDGYYYTNLKLKQVSTIEPSDFI